MKNGLQLVVNVEQYQYMKGPHNAVGLKLLLHQQDDVPLVQDFGESVPVGMHTFVAVSHTKVGIDFYKTYSIAQNSPFLVWSLLKT